MKHSTKKSLRTPVDPKQIYEQARRFKSTDEYLRNSTEGDWVAIPTMVCSVFASELFLKCIHEVVPVFETGG
jgi:hypothetical protein